MMRISSALSVPLALFVMLVSGQEASEARREHGVHVHGVGHLSIAADERLLVIELEAPGIDIFGFERAPRDAEERGAAGAMLALLEHGAALFGLNAEARCAFRSAEVVASFLDADGGDGTHQHDHGNRSGDSAAGEVDPGHAHEPRLQAHADGPNHDHGEAGRHDHGEPHGFGEHATGSDVIATYGFECAAVDRLRRIDVRVFDHFPSFDRIEAVFIGVDGQRYRSLTRGAATIDVR
jgi:hypothetical protein